MDSLKTMTFVMPHQITNTFFKKIFCKKKNRSTRHDLNNKEVSLDEFNLLHVQIRKRFWEDSNVYSRKYTVGTMLLSNPAFMKRI